VNWTAAQVRTYDQRDGKVIFEVATLLASDAGERCSGVK